MYLMQNEQKWGNFEDDQLKCQDREVEMRKGMEKEECVIDMWSEIILDNNEIKEPDSLERFHDLHDINQERVFGEGSSSVVSVNPQLAEYVESSFKPNKKLSLDMMCIKCNNMVANVLTLPCKHLCLCYLCNEDYMACPICNSSKTDNVIINLPCFTSWI